MSGSDLTNSYTSSLLVLQSTQYPPRMLTGCIQFDQKSESVFCVCSYGIRG